MKHGLSKEFKARWRSVRTFEEKESRNLSVAQKFQQLSSLVGMAIGLGAALKEDEEKIKTRARWILLKNAQNGKFA